MPIFPNIEAERARRGLTVAELTNKLHVCRKTYYNWIASGEIPQEKLQAMADLFGVSADYLLGLTVQTKRSEQEVNLMSEKSMSEIREERMAALRAQDAFREQKASDIAPMFNGCTLPDANAILELVRTKIMKSSVVTFECN